jgi:hypothetical protein
MRFREINPGQRLDASLDTKSERPITDLLLYYLGQRRSLWTLMSVRESKHVLPKSIGRIIWLEVSIREADIQLHVAIRVFLF